VNIKLPHQWKPRPYQQPLWNYLGRGGKRAVVRWHRRSGKDDVFLHHTACAAHERIGNYWYLLPEYAQARKSMWDAINGNTGKKRIDEAFPKELRKTTKDQEMMIQFHCGSTFQLVGSDNFNSLVGSPPVGLVFSEYALSLPSSWAYLMPILEENGGWAGFNSTPRGKNHFKSLCEFAQKEKGWYYDALNARQTGVFTEEQLSSILRQMQSTHGIEFGQALFDQEYFVSFDAAIPGSIWGDCIRKLELNDRIGSVPHDPDFPVSTAWDLGRTDDTAIWFFQLIAGEINIIDYHSSSLQEIDFYADILRGAVDAGDTEDVKALKARTKQYSYGTHWIPHDARPRRLGMGGKSILQQFQDHKVGRFVIAPNLDRQEGIQAARKTFPRCSFDKENCEQGIECLKQYHREWDEDNRVFLNDPHHDWSSHASDAFRYLSLVWKHPKSKEPSQPLHDRLMKSNVVGQTFGQIKSQHFSKMRARRDEVIH
jgi:phage terminase large subunit